MSADVDAAVERLRTRAWRGGMDDDSAADVRLVLAALEVAQNRVDALTDLARVAIRGSLR